MKTCLIESNNGHSYSVTPCSLGDVPPLAGVACHFRIYDTLFEEKYHKVLEF